MSKMTFDEYQEFVATVKRYPQQYNVLYPALGLCGEAGEVAEKVKKRVRDGTKESFKQDITRELGDVLWYVMQCLIALDTDINEVVSMNIDKLEKRYPGGQFGAYYSENRETNDI